jgi:NAD(P)-dependent dehydrogenase (short-subunit alcohol dehydrogenase family)
MSFLFAFHLAVRVMLLRGWSVIVDINLVLAECIVPNATLYCAAKGAVWAFRPAAARAARAGQAP